MASKSVSRPKTRASADSELLELIVAINLSDRLEAMAIRDSDGPEAAIKFIRETCTLTNEQYTPSVDATTADNLADSETVIEIESDLRLALGSIRAAADLLYVCSATGDFEALHEDTVQGAAYSIDVAAERGLAGVEKLAAARIAARRKGGAS